MILTLEYEAEQYQVHQRHRGVQESVRHGLATNNLMLRNAQRNMIPEHKLELTLFLIALARAMGDPFSTNSVEP